jgi:hypothetical protein
LRSDLGNHAERVRDMLEYINEARAVVGALQYSYILEVLDIPGESDGSRWRMWLEDVDSRSWKLARDQTPQGPKASTVVEHGRRRLSRKGANHRPPMLKGDGIGLNEEPVQEPDGVSVKGLSPDGVIPTVVTPCLVPRGVHKSPKVFEGRRRTVRTRDERGQRSPFLWGQELCVK